MRRQLAPMLAWWMVAGLAGSTVAAERGGEDFFEKKIRPVLAERCYSCHSDKTESPKGGLRLDTREALRRGGESGPAIEPGKPDQSLLIQALRHESLEMPPKSKLPDDVIADFAAWVAMGAPDPRVAIVTSGPSPADGWEQRYQERRLWWSAQKVAHPEPPQVYDDAWCRNEIDHFVLARLEAEGLRPAQQAERRHLIRRLSFALVGLPPEPGEVERFAADPSPEAYEQLVDRLLGSPHFGERWARHWMDVVHYADTHGYEWDIPAKGAWMYRDYLVRAFNRDVPFRQLILEHLAGDLLPQPRIDADTNLNESLIGLASMRMGERRHGDSAEFDGIHQEAIDNTIDTVTKAFQATTVACARCHDHKLDAVAQSDYYALAGALMSSRWVCRVVDACDPNLHGIEQLRSIKKSLRPVLADLWLRQLEGFAADLPSLPGAKPAGESTPKVDTATKDNTTTKAETAPTDKPARWAGLLKPEAIAEGHPLHTWRAVADATAKGEEVATVWQRLANRYHTLHEERAAANRKNLRLVADFTQGTMPAGWQTEGFALQHGFVPDGELIVADDGPRALRHILPAGLYTHVFSPRLAGALRSPLGASDTPWLSLQVVAGDIASRHVVVDNAMFPESRYQFLEHATPTWHTVSMLSDDVAKGRRIYVELNTKTLNNYYPARVGLTARFTEEQREGPRSWFGVTRVYAHDGKATAPVDELARFDRLFAGEAPQSAAEAATRIENWLRQAVEAWRDQKADAEDVTLLNWMLDNQLLANRTDASPLLARLVSQYRAVEAGLQAQRVVGGVADLAEGRDERIAIRGSYTELGQAVPRGYIRLVTGDGRNAPLPGSGRLEIANIIASPDNPLTARVFVNRVWSYLFGSGLVATVDDFGHLGEKPSDPELLDHLASRFVDDGWSVKKLIRRIVTSATWRQSVDASAQAETKDPDNRLWHHYPLRRLEAEAIRDAILVVSGRYDPQLYGPSIDPFRASEDKDKRLFCGLVDGAGRRSLYVKMTLMEPPKFLAIFNQPLPKLTLGHRDATNVPDQALALLNDPFVVNQAEHWARQVVDDRSTTVAERVDSMFLRALGRPPRSDEQDQFVAFVAHVAQLRGVEPAATLAAPVVWQDVAHVIFNLKEFIYVR